MIQIRNPKIMNKSIDFKIYTFFIAQNVAL